MLGEAALCNGHAFTLAEHERLERFGAGNTSVRFVLPSGELRFFRPRPHASESGLVGTAASWVWLAAARILAQFRD